MVACAYGHSPPPVIQLSRTTPLKRVRRGQIRSPLASLSNRKRVPRWLSPDTVGSDDLRASRAMLGGRLLHPGQAVALPERRLTPRLRALRGWGLRWGRLRDVPTGA